MLRLQRSFANSDLVVIDWDAALVIDLTGYLDDVLYVLELANLQLEEFRLMDRALDALPRRAYRDLERRRRCWAFRAVAGLRLRQFRVDLARLTDEVTNITKFFGDWHLARVYLAGPGRFYLEQWRQASISGWPNWTSSIAVQRRGQYERRMLWLEIVIVILFVIDVAALFFFKK